MAREIRQVALEASWMLSAVSDREEYIAAALDLVQSVVPAESIGRFELDPSAGSALLHSDPPEHTSAPIIDAFAGYIGTHPTLISWIADPDDLSPRRVSDVASVGQWRKTPVFSELYVPMGVRHNLTFLTKPLASGMVAGWSMCRQGSDFDDAEVDFATALQPMLAALDLFHDRARTTLSPPGESASDAMDAARRAAGLTPREADVLALLAAGLTARQIGRVRRISPLTVRKHLEHVYEKLGAHDRMLAVDRGRRLGLLPPVADHWQIQP